MANTHDTSTTGIKGEGKNHNVKRFMGRIKINASYMIAYDSQTDSVVSYQGM